MTDAASTARPRRPALSPSRAADFRRCPLLYRLRAIDRLPEPSSRAQLRGALVHAVLEALYALPAAQRGPVTAQLLLGPAAERLAADAATVGGLPDEVRAALLAEAGALLSRYYRLEDPRRFDPAGCEHRVEVELDDGTPLRGIVDRIDVAPDGQLRIVDYKTGASPPETWGPATSAALFQMKFYALALWRVRGVVPTRLRLIYLTDGALLEYSPDAEELRRFAVTLTALWRAITAAGATGDFPPSPSRWCDRCAHRSRCPAFGGTPPPYPGWPQPAAEHDAQAEPAARDPLRT